MKVIKESQDILPQVALFLKEGGIVICPTDTVYGFLADAGNEKTVNRVFAIKKRLKSKPLSLFIKDMKMAEGLALINQTQANMLKKYWPGKYTFILPRKPKTKVYGIGEQTVALRIPDYPFLNDLLKKFGKPLAQTSVNISGKRTLDTISAIIEQFGSKKILIIDGGDRKNSKASKLIDATKDTINVLRP